MDYHPRRPRQRRRAGKVDLARRSWHSQGLAPQQELCCLADGSLQGWSEYSDGYSDGWGAVQAPSAPMPLVAVHPLALAYANLLGRAMPWVETLESPVVMGCIDMDPANLVFRLREEDMEDSSFYRRAPSTSSDSEEAPLATQDLQAGAPHGDVEEPCELPPAAADGLNDDICAALSSSTMSWAARTASSSSWEQSASSLSSSSSSSASVVEELAALPAAEGIDDIADAQLVADQVMQDLAKALATRAEEVAVTQDVPASEGVKCLPDRALPSGDTIEPSPRPRQASLPELPVRYAPRISMREAPAVSSLAGALCLGLPRKRTAGNR